LSEQNQEINNTQNNTNITTETIATNIPLSKDDLQFQKLMQANFAQLAKLVRHDFNENKQVEYAFYKNFNRDKVQQWLSKPQSFEKQLREVVRFLFVSSSHFRRAVLYFATLPMFKYTIEMYGCSDFDELEPKNVKKKYLDVVNYVDVMNVEHEYAKISLICWLEDTFFGYEYRLKDSFFIQPLDPNFCKISSIEDGVYNFQFDLSYYNARLEELDRVAPEFKEKYTLYLSDRKKYRWQELSSERSICQKINENCEYSVPPFSGILESLYDIEDFKQLKKSKTELENYLILGFSIPYMKNATSENQFALSLDKSLEFYNLAVDQLPEMVGALLSPFDKIEAIRVDKSEKSINTVEEAEDAFYNDTGISKLLFNSGNASGASLTKSVEIDEMLVYKFLKQSERLINRKLKLFCKKIFFKLHFLEMTYMSKDDYIKNVKEGSMAGVPCKMRYASALGLSPSATIHNEYLEKVLGIPERWLPLNSSFTQSGNNGGRPNTNEDELSPSAEVTIEQDANNPDNRT